MAGCVPPTAWSGFPALAEALEEWDEALLTENRWLFHRLQTGRPSPNDLDVIADWVVHWPLCGLDWREAFGFAGEPRTHGSPDVSQATRWAVVATTPFARADVVRVSAEASGLRDGDPWMCLGRLADGRWFGLKAWCSHAGWDVAGSGSVAVAATEDDALRFGFTSEDRVRLGRLLVGVDDTHIAAAIQTAEEKRRRVVDWTWGPLLDACRRFLTANANNGYEFETNEPDLYAAIVSAVRNCDFDK